MLAFETVWKLHLNKYWKYKHYNNRVANGKYEQSASLSIKDLSDLSKDLKRIIKANI